MAKRYRSNALAAVHETAQGLHEAGAMDKRTMKVFDVLCLTPVEKLSPGRIRAIRLREKGEAAGRRDQRCSPRHAERDKAG